MNPDTLIVAALAAGAAKGVTDSTAKAVADLYGQLKSAIGGRFADNAPAQMVLSEHAKDPESYDKPLTKQLTENGADTDPQILELAQAILQHTDPSGAKIGKYNVDVRGARNVQLGDHNTQHNA